MSSVWYIKVEGQVGQVELKPSKIRDIKSLLAHASSELQIAEREIDFIIWERNKYRVSQPTRLIKMSSDSQLSSLKQEESDQDLYVVLKSGSSMQQTGKHSKPNGRRKKIRKKQKAPHVELINPEWKAEYDKLDSAQSKIDSMFSEI